MSLKKLGREEEALEAYRKARSWQGSKEWFERLHDLDAIQREAMQVLFPGADEKMTD